MKHAMGRVTDTGTLGEHISTELAFQAMGLGVRGILRKTRPRNSRSSACRKCIQRLWFEKAPLPTASLRPPHRSQREDPLVNLLSQGLKNKRSQPL